MIVLIVDDHPFMRLGLRVAIRGLAPDATIVEAATGEQALLACEARAPHLIVADVVMPGSMGGIQLTRRLRAGGQSIPVLIVCGDVSSRIVREALAAGASGVLCKSVASDLLQPAIRAVLAGACYLCPESKAAYDNSHGAETGRDEASPDVLSSREREVLILIAEGETTTAIAATLVISPKTVESHRLNIMHRLRVDSVVALTRYAIKHNLCKV